MIRRATFRRRQAVEHGEAAGANRAGPRLRAGAALFAAAAWISSFAGPAPGTRPAEEEREGEGSGEKSSEELSPRGLQVLETLRAQVTAELEKAVPASASGPQGRSGALQALWERAEARLLEETALAERPALTQLVEAHLRAELARLGSLSSQEAASRVGDARQGAGEARLSRLYNRFKCWCPSEDWSRTVASCWENCANQQKELIQQWVAEGYSDAEIERLMLDRAGTEKVLAVEKGPATYALPYAILAAAALFVALMLAAVLRRSRGGAAEAGGAGEGGFERRLEEELERELKELDE